MSTASWPFFSISVIFHNRIGIQWRSLSSYSDSDPRELPPPCFLHLVKLPPNWGEETSSLHIVGDRRITKQNGSWNTTWNTNDYCGTLVGQVFSPCARLGPIGGSWQHRSACRSKGRCTSARSVFWLEQRCSGRPWRTTDGRDNPRRTPEHYRMP